MKVAIVHDWLNQVGGAEGVLEALHDLYPGAPVYTSIYAPDRMPAAYRSWDIRVTFMQRLPFVAARHQAYLPLYPLAFRGMDLSAYDLVISNASAFCKGIRTRPGAVHLCYCLTPTRFLWMYREYVQREGLGRLPRAVLPAVVGLLRAWDRHAADRVTAFAAISRAVQERIRRFYGRDSVIIYPPVPESAFARADTAPRDEGYYLSLGRLIPYKRVDLAVRAFNRLGLPLVIIGDGRDRAALERLASPNVRFLGRVSDEEKRHWLAGCRAFLFPGEEDFGIAPLEAQAAGKPVIAYAAGGALDTVQEGITGEYFRQPTAESLAEAVSRFNPAAYDPAACLANARRFDTAAFNAGWRSFVAAHLPSLPTVGERP
jgi:glycosyltransferase involved in cell wall biosynthesis